jgi:hypothetical protein
MSAAEEPTVQPTETKPVEAPVSAEPVAESSSAAIVPETAPETAILSKDPITVADNLEKADPVSTEAIASSTLAAADTTAPEEATASEGAPATPEKHKEGSSLLNFMKKYVPNPKGGVEKKTPGLAGSGKAVVNPTDAPAKTDEITPVAETPVVVEPTEEESFEGGNIQFKNHGGLFGYLYAKLELMIVEDGKLVHWCLEKMILMAITRFFLISPRTRQLLMCLKRRKSMRLGRMLLMPALLVLDSYSSLKLKHWIFL